MTTWVKPTLSGPQAIVCGLVVLVVALLPLTPGSYDVVVSGWVR